MNVSSCTSNEWIKLLTFIRFLNTLNNTVEENVVSFKLKSKGIEEILPDGDYKGRKIQG
jgi:hypothetical protein